MSDYAVTVNGSITESGLSEASAQAIARTSRKMWPRSVVQILKVVPLEICPVCGK